MTNKKHKISFCTVCMNRLHHLKKTLPKNIEDNISYGNVEFVVLNYNSKDAIDKWIFTEMIEYINTGILVYIKTEEPQYFLRSHSKNIAAKKASGDIVCNVDADNFIGEGFAKYINELFIKDKNSYFAVKKNSGSKDCYGRIGLFKDDFISITGYDESMTDYGFEDFDIQNRLDLLGRKAKYITNTKFLKVLNHDDITRIENEPHINEIDKIYIRYINHYSSELLFLFKNNNYTKGLIMVNRLINSESIDNAFNENRTYEYTNSLENDSWEKGVWYRELYGIKTIYKTTTITELIQTKKRELQNKKDVGMKYYECTKTELFEEMVMFLSQISNRIKMKQNKANKKIHVNEVFGETVLIENKLPKQQ
ncbi:MAG: glycosyltransferase family A protein [Algibacter sp.]